MSSTQTHTTITASSNSAGLTASRMTTGDAVTAPLQPTGAIDTWAKTEVTPLIGSTIVGVDLAQVLRSADCDAMIRDLAILVSRRGFCVFPNQASLSIEDQKLLCRKLGQLTTRPSTSGVYIHPVNQTTLPDGTVDPELMAPARDPKKKLYTREGGFSKGSEARQSRADGWHTDGTYEHVPADYTLLHMKKTPATGGDTLFASSYEAYDLLSKPMARMLEGLSAVFMPPNHKPEDIIDRMWKGPRGAPENVGADLRAKHPCIRTNPVTGWKSLWAFGHHLEAIEGLGDVENKVVIDFLQRLITENHQLQARVKWSKDDLVIWDNRSVFHCATYDYGGSGIRSANRICGSGEVPYLDPRSSGRRSALGITAN